MSTEPIRTTDYDTYMQARERQVRAEIVKENEELRELAHRLTFELENAKAECASMMGKRELALFNMSLQRDLIEKLKAYLSQEEAIRWSLQERYVNLAADVLAIPVKEVVKCEDR